MPATRSSIPRLLFLEARNRPEWSVPSTRAELLELDAEDGRLADAVSRGQKVDPEACLDLARRHREADYVLAECTAAFLWHAVFRLAGNDTPFLIVPRYNHVLGPDTYALFLSSQLAGPGDRMFAGSNAASRSFARFGFDCDPLYLPGLDLRIFRRLPETRASLKRSLGLDPVRDLLLYTGRMAEDKNLPELLEAFAQVKQHRPVDLVLCYNFPRETCLSACRQQAAAIGDVRFVADPDTESLVRYYNAADLFVSAAVSFYETFGRSPVEAMACGTPPVVAEYDGFRDTITPDAGFLVPTTWNGPRKWPDVAGFAETIRGALEDPDGLAARSQAAPDQAGRFEKSHSIQSLLSRLEPRPAASAERQGATVSLSGYPPEIAALWEPLERRPVQDLVCGFLATRKLPVRPPEAAVQSFFTSWFAHY